MSRSLEEENSAKIEVADDDYAHNGNGNEAKCMDCNDKSVENEPASRTDNNNEKMNMVSAMELFRFADKRDVLYMFVGTICSILHGAAPPCLCLVFGKMADAFIYSGNSSNNTTNMTQEQIKAENFDVLNDQIRTYSYYYVGIGFGVLVVAYVHVTLWLQSSHRQAQKIRVELFRAVLRQEIGWFDTHDAGELGTQLADGIVKIQEGIGDKIGNFLQWCSTFITGLVIGLVYGWKLTLVILSACPLLVIAGGMTTFLITKAAFKELAAYAKAGAVVEETLSSIRTVVAFCGQIKECKRYAMDLNAAEKFGIRKSMISGIGMGFTFLITFLTYALAFWYGGKLVRDEPSNYTAGVMLIVFFCMVIGAFTLGNAMPNLEYIGTARGAAYVIWNLIDRESNIDSSSVGGIQPADLTGNIELKDVFFHYPSRPGVMVANGLNIQVKKGQTVALVGASGCGKSTVVQLILRFYDPLSGSVLLDGMDVRQLNIKWLRRNIGFVGQEPNLFATTIADNIRYGRDGVTQDDIERAATEANAHTFISKLPLKYETVVGERGAQLSGGQKQRIAIARSLVRNPRVLLLDEATSALDNESEALVQSALDKARLGRTTIVIAHRLSTIKNADIIYGIKDGVVRELGNHDELMALGGIYSDLVKNQQAIEAEEEPMNQARDTSTSSNQNCELERSVCADSINRMQATDELNDDPLKVSDLTKKENHNVPSISRILALNKQEWPYILVGCIAGLVQGGIQPMFAILFSSILGVFASQDLQYQEDKIFFYSMMLIVVGGGAAISMFFQAFMFGISGERLTKRLRIMTFKAILRQEIAFFDDHNNSTGALATRLSTDASAIQGATGVRLGMVFQSFANIGTGIIIGFIFSWELTLFISGFVPFFLIFGILETKVKQGFSSNDNNYLEQAGKIANEAIVNVRTVASLTKEAKFVSDYQEVTYPPFRTNMRKAHISGIAYAFSQSLIFFAYAAIFTFGAWLIENRGLNYEDMFLVFSAIVFGAMALGQASAFAPNYGKAKSAAACVFALIDQQPSIDSYSTEGTKPISCNGGIEFRNVGFRYPTRPNVAVLAGLTFSVQQGQVVALVGTSGCGKSTTLQLLERLYDPESGEVLIDGVDLRQLQLAWLRSQIGIVSQEPILFDCTIAENIAYGDNGRQVTMGEIISAAKTANVHSFIESLPEGYKTNVGAKGTQLSGGQKQRIAIARAIVRDPKILLLDEATSALDTEGEKVVQEALERAQQGRTSLVVAHRLSTIQNANMIMVIRCGVVTEQGTHSELLAYRGVYYNMHTAQARKR